MSGVLENPAYKAQFNDPKADAQGAIVASMPAGSLVGALFSTWLADRIGRKKCVILAGCIWVIGSVLQCASVNRGMLVVGRVISGISVGIASAIVPLYQSEVTAPHLRGRMVSLQQWSITWGILIQYFIQFGCSYMNTNASFRIPWGLQMIPAVILSIGMMWFPESPRWLVDHGHEDEALEILADLHGKGDANNELVLLEFEEIKQQVYFERTEGAKSYLDLLKPGVPRRVGLGMALQMWSQLSGMNVMMYYIVYVFEGAGIKGRRGNLIASSVNYVLNVVMTVPAILYIDKWGRRPMLIAGSAFMGTFLYLVGGLQGGFGHWSPRDTNGERTWLLDDGHDGLTKAIIVFSYLAVCSFAITLGPVSWTYPAEIFPMRVRAKAVSISTATNWVFNFALAYCVPPALRNLGYRTYFIFATFNYAASIHFFFMYPETAGRTLEEIEDVFNEGHVFSAWNVKRNVGKKTLGEVEDETRAKEKYGEDYIEEKVTTA